MNKRVCFAIILIFLYSCASTGTSNLSKTNTYDHWLKEEVALLITEEEEKEFLGLQNNDEKEKFKKIFWAKRDPSSGTEENEFMDEWYRRLEHVKKTFTRGTSKGWRSDMGKVYMFFGPPGETRAGQPRKLDRAVGGNQQKLGEQVWIYQPMPDLGLTSRFQVIFREYQYGYELDFQTPQIIQRALEIFSGVVIFNPEINDIPRYRFFLDKNSFEGKLIDELVVSGDGVNGIPIEWKPIYSQASNGDTHVSFLVRIDTRQSDRDRFKEMAFFGKIKGEGPAEEEFLKSVKTIETEKGVLLATFGLPAKPGESVLYLGAMGSDKNVYSLLKSDLYIPNFWNDELDISTVILTHEVVPASQSENQEEFDPFKIGRFKTTPRWGNIFKQNESMNALFQIYNPKLENDSASLKVEYFILSDKVNYRLNPQEIKQKVEPGRTIAGGTEISLDPLEPGDYTFRIKVIDNIAGKSIEIQTDFVVE